MRRCQKPSKRHRRQAFGIWQCNQKYKNEKRCTTPFLYEATIKARFLTAANILLAGRSDAIRTCEAAIKTVFDLTDLLDYTTVYADGRMTFTFKNGQTIDG